MNPIRSDIWNLGRKGRLLRLREVLCANTNEPILTSISAY